MLSNPIATHPPLVLIFGPFDPTGASNLPADAVTCAMLGCHALSAITATRIQDTRHTEEILVASPEFLDDQARSLLEDMAVKAIKVGPTYTTETVSAIAQIAADYNHVPLIVHLGPLPSESLLHDLDAEEMQTALFELLLPLTDIVIADHSLLLQWQAQGLLAHDTATPGQALLAHGALWALSTGVPLRAGQLSLLLEGQNNQTANWPWQAPAPRLEDPDGPLACAITAELAKGAALGADAVRQAIAMAAPLAARSFQPGMGQRLIMRSLT